MPHPDLSSVTVKSDHERPVAVFLGPSLPSQAARALLDAQYLPPAQFGDVYRLIGSGVRTIVLIDGVFHGRAPVWQRELCYAMQSGIRVYGASSMGALRAAELHTHGMIGLGSVFQWYVKGEIDGDDEVALLHAGPEQMYRPLSEPLVNIRFNLREAVARGILEPEQAAALTAAMKALPFFQRTLGALWNTPSYGSLDESHRSRLRAFFTDHGVDLKQRDAAEGLREVARRQDKPEAVAISAADPGIAGSYHDRFRLLKRSIPSDRCQRLEGQALVERVLSDPTRRKLLQWSLGARFFVRAWASESRVSVPADELRTMALAWRDRVGVHSLTDWLRANGLTAAEHHDLLARHLLCTWLLSRAPERFGLPSALQDEALLPAFPAPGLLQPICERAAVARALPYVAAWCQSIGALPGPKASQVLTDRWRDALAYLEERCGQASCEPFLQAIWALEKGPVHFGYTSWSLTTELLCELQITGTAAKLAAAWDASTA